MTTVVDDRHLGQPNLDFLWLTRIITHPEGGEREYLWRYLQHFLIALHKAMIPATMLNTSRKELRCSNYCLFGELRFSRAQK